MAEAARVGSTSSGVAERARRLQEAVHSVRMEGLDLTADDAADAAEYVAGRIDLGEYGRRTRARYGVPEADRPGPAGPVTPAAASRAAAGGPAAVQRGR